MKNLALQLYSVRDFTEKDFVGTIKKVARFGYKGVEFAGYGGLTAVQMKALLSETGLEATASHVGFDNLKNNLEAEIAYAKEIGIPYLVCPWADIKTKDDTLLLAEDLSKISEICKQNDLSVAYHNHAHELIKDNDDYLLEILFQNAPNLLAELDIYWLAYAGVDVLSFIKKYKNRLPLIHLKELSAEHTNVDIGKGILDWASIISTAKELGTTGFIVEQEAYAVDSMVSAKNDIDYLAKL